MEEFCSKRRVLVFYGANGRVTLSAVLRVGQIFLSERVRKFKIGAMPSPVAKWLDSQCRATAGVGMSLGESPAPHDMLTSA